MTVREYFRQNLVSGAVLLAALGTGVTAHAAEAPPTASNGGSMLSEVVVTASRRQSTAISTPIDISALTSSDLQRQGVKDFHDLTRVVPGLVYNASGIRTGGATNSFILHGLNLDDVNNGGDTPLPTYPPVTVYVDETPTFINLHLADVERVEVLRGPQATLYGDASIAGTVRVLFNQPDLNKDSAEISTDTGYTYHATGPNYSVDAVINHPITDYLGFRVAAGYTFENGFIDAPHMFALDSHGAPLLADPSDPVHSIPVQTSRKDVDDADQYYVRPMLLYKKDNLKVLLTYQHQHEWSQGPDQDSYPGGQLPSSYSDHYDAIYGGPGPYVPNHAPTLTGSPFQAGDAFDAAFPTKFKPYQTGDFILQPMTRDVDVGSIEVAYDLGFATLTSVTSGYGTHSTAVDDSSAFYQQSLGFFYDGYPRLLLTSKRNYVDSAFVQEVRLVSKSTGPLTYSVGMFYMNEHNHLVQQDFLEGYSAYETANSMANTGTDLGYVDDRTIAFSDIAGFGELSYHVTPKFQITGGVRVFSQTLIMHGITELPICGSGCDSNNDSPLGLSEGGNKEVTTRPLFKYNMSYEFLPHFLGYFTFSQGERRGGANGTPTKGPFAESPAFQYFQPDTLDNYELGFKGRIGGRFEFSSAFYWDEWHNPQVNVSTPNGSFPAAVNGKGARSQGVDLEGRYKVNDDITLSATYGYNQAKLTETIQVFNPTTNQFVNYGSNGSTLPGTPHHTFSFGVDYDHPIHDDLQLEIHADYSYRSGMSTSLTPDENENLTGFSMVDASVGITTGKWRASLYANNLTNARGVLSANNPLRYDVRGLNERLSRPATVGLRLGYKYN
jgi:iron complex outermembrane receptor protein